MLKDIDFNISYDINSYQDISQKLMSKIRSYADKYNLTILFVHHLNKLGKILGSTGFDAVVDGIIRLSKNCYDDSTIKMEIINRDFPNDEERTQFNIEYVGFDGHSTLSSKVYETIYTNNIHFNKGDNTNILNGCIVTSGPDFFRKLGLPMKDTGRVYVEGNHAGGPVFCPDINSKEDIPKKMLEYFNESYRFLSKYVEEKKCSLCRS